MNQALAVPALLQTIFGVTWDRLGDQLNQLNPANTSTPQAG